MTGAIAFSAGYALDRWRHPAVISHSVVRTLAIASHAGQMQSADWLLLGDSLVELANVPTLCGGTVLNAGLGGARVADMTLPIGFKTRHIVVAVGVNDATWKSPTALDEFVSLYKRLVDVSRATGAEIFISTIGAVAHEMQIGDEVFNRDMIYRFNTEIKKIAESENLKLIDFSTMADSSGYLPKDQTTDGIHLKPNGYMIWRGILEKAACHLNQEYH